MFKKGEAVDVKVPTNFLNWDQCQFAGEEKLDWKNAWRSRCKSYMTKCPECAARQKCQEVRSCESQATESLDLKPKEIESVQPVLDVQKEPASTVSVAEADADRIADSDQETVQSSPQQESAAPIADPVATPTADTVADPDQEDVQS